MTGASHALAEGDEKELDVWKKQNTTRAGLTLFSIPPLSVLAPCDHTHTTCTPNPLLARSSRSALLIPRPLERDASTHTHNSNRALLFRPSFFLLRLAHTLSTTTTSLFLSLSLIAFLALPIRVRPPHPHMPLTIREAALLGFGTLSIAGAVLAWRAKATTPFKALYAAAWVTAGPGIILAVTPSDERLLRRLDAAGTDMREVDEVRVGGRAAVAAVLKAAGRE